MDWPTPQDYNEAIQNPSISFSDAELKAGEAETNASGLPRPVSGAFASVYHFNCQDRQWAVRCFLHRIEDQQRRYEELSRFISNDDLECTVPFAFLSEGIRIHGQWYPLLKMEWVQGQTLHMFIQENLSLTGAIADLAQRFKTLCMDLQHAGIAHGDLQHGNIMVLRDGRLRLVDYDGMFVPALRGMPSNELGHRNYQHPGRQKFHFGPYLDNFSAWVIYCSLYVVAEHPEFWHRLSGGDECMLFRQADFIDPLSSPVFALLEHQQNQSIAALAKTVRYLCTLAIEQVPALGSDVAIPADFAPMPSVDEIEQLNGGVFTTGGGGFGNQLVRGFSGNALQTATATKTAPAVRLKSAPASNPRTQTFAPAAGTHTKGAPPAGQVNRDLAALRRGTAIATLMIGVVAMLGLMGVAIKQVDRGRVSPQHTAFPPVVPVAPVLSVVPRPSSLDSARRLLDQGTAVALRSVRQPASNSKQALDRALSDLNTASTAYVYRASAEFFGAIIAERMGNLKEALDRFSAAIAAASPSSAVGAVGSTADVPLQRGQTWPRISEAYFQRGKVYFELQNYPQAIADYTQCIALADPPLAYFRRALAYQATSNLDDALKDINRYITRSPKDPQGYTTRAQIERSLGDKRAAAEDVRRAAARTKHPQPVTATKPPKVMTAADSRGRLQSR